MVFLVTFSNTQYKRYTAKNWPVLQAKMEIKEAQIKGSSASGLKFKLNEYLDI